MVGTPATFELGDHDPLSREVPLHALVEDCVAALLPRARRRGVRLGCAFTPDCPTVVSTDPDRLRQAPARGGWLAAVAESSTERPGWRHPSTPRVARNRPGPQVLVQLLSQALQHTTCGAVEVWVGVSASAGASAFELRFEVKDSGCGMSPRDSETPRERAIGYPSSPYRCAHNSRRTRDIMRYFGTLRGVL